MVRIFRDFLLDKYFLFGSEILFSINFAFCSRLIYHLKMIVNNLLLTVLIEVQLFAVNSKLPFKITAYRSDISTDISLNRRSKTHLQGRAVDISTRHWKRKHVLKLCSYLNIKYQNIAAISYSDKKPRVCVYHRANYKGAKYHIHLQVKRSLKLYVKKP